MVDAAAKRDFLEYGKLLNANAEFKKQSSAMKENKDKLENRIISVIKRSGGDTLKVSDPDGKERFYKVVEKELKIRPTKTDMANCLIKDIKRLFPNINITPEQCEKLVRNMQDCAGKQHKIKLAVRKRK